MTISPLQKSLDELPFPVDDGTLVRPRDGGYYVSDAPPPPGIWSRYRAEHPRTGLWPVFLQCHETATIGPWEEEWAGFRWIDSSPDHGHYEAAAVLETQWDYLNTLADDATPDEVSECAALRKPFGRAWPGPAGGNPIRLSPDRIADDLAERLINDAETRLGLITAARGADVPEVTRWWAGEQISPGAVSAVLRSWEDRFGARLIRIGFSTMVLSVAAPPTTLSAAQRVAAEHLAFCQENIEYDDGGLARYAEEILGVHHWSFWWDREPPGWFYED